MADFVLEPASSLVAEIVGKAVELYENDMGDRGCIGDASCECFGCLLNSEVETCATNLWQSAITDNIVMDGELMTNERKNITQPADWWAAFEADAKRRGLTLSEFIGLAASKMLTREQRKELSQRIKPGRKKNED